MKAESTTDEITHSSSSQSLLKELRHIINKLPETHLNTLDYLMKHLKKVADNESNNMPANNLGKCFEAHHIGISKLYTYILSYSNRYRFRANSTASE